jgi:hypothetical protein
MKSKKKIIFSIYTMISFFFLVIFFLYDEKKNVSVYQIEKNDKEIKLNLFFFETLFNFKVEESREENTKYIDFYRDVALNYNHSDYSNSTNMILNYYELFNKQLKNQLTINSFKSETVLEKYSHKNIPKRIYEVKIISKNPEDAQKFFEKNLSQALKENNHELLKMIYSDYLTRKIRLEFENQSNIDYELILMEECKEKIKDKNFQYLFNFESEILKRCNYLNNLTLIEKEIKKLQNNYNDQLNKMKNLRLYSDYLQLEINDLFFKNLIQINKIPDKNKINYLHVFVGCLLSLILVWILVFKTNYLNFLFNNKLFKFPK